MKIWCVGDIHGCYDELIALWQKLPIDVEHDLVVFMGDYIDRGPDSKKVVERLIKWHKEYPHWVFLYGNHEDIFKNFLDQKQKYQEDTQWSCFFANGGKETLKSYGGWAEVGKYGFPKDHQKFLFEETKIMYETDKYIFVHAGLIPKETIDNLKILITPKFYGYKTIINALLWARDDFIDSKWDWGKKVVFGHSAAHKSKWGKLGQPIIMKNKIGIDGAVYPPSNKNLIAVELPKEKFYFQESLK
jgi:serine/threonine protein phosphatase 1